jgi:hypothetical protein
MDILFEINASNNIVVRTTKAYWEKIVRLKHPSMRGEEERVKLTLTDPEEIRQSKKTKDVLLYYKDFMDYYICVVVKLTDGEGFIVTTYKTEKIKEGEIIWRR